MYCQFVDINERTYYYKRTENFPKPIILCAETVIYASSVKFGSDSVGYFVIPNNISDTERDVSDKEAKQAVMHCSFSVLSACNDVDVIAYGRQNNDSVDTESYQ